MRLPTAAAALALTACTGAGPRFLALPEAARGRPSAIVVVNEGEHLAVLAFDVAEGRVKLDFEPSAAAALSLISLDTQLSALGIAPGPVEPAALDACERAPLPTTGALYYSAELAQGEIGAWRELIELSPLVSSFRWTAPCPCRVFRLEQRVDIPTNFTGATIRDGTVYALGDFTDVSVQPNQHRTTVYAWAPGSSAEPTPLLVLDELYRSIYAAPDGTLWVAGGNEPDVAERTPDGRLTMHHVAGLSGIRAIKGAPAPGGPALVVLDDHGRVAAYDGVAWRPLIADAAPTPGSRAQAALTRVTATELYATVEDGTALFHLEGDHLESIDLEDRRSLTQLTTTRGPLGVIGGSYFGELVQLQGLVLTALPRNASVQKSVYALEAYLSGAVAATKDGFSEVHPSHGACPLNTTDFTDTRAILELGEAVIIGGRAPRDSHLELWR